MRIVADIARRPLTNDVLVVFFEAAGPTADNAGAVVAFVAKRVVGGAFAGVVGNDILTLKQFGKSRSMRAVGSRTAIVWPRIVVVA